jgi:hypothetical protein
VVWACGWVWGGFEVLILSLVVVSCHLAVAMVKVRCVLQIKHSCSLSVCKYIRTYVYIYVYVCPLVCMRVYVLSLCVVVARYM